MRIHLCILTALLLASGGVNAAEVLDVLEVNGHPGYITAYQVSPDGIVDKVLMLVSGFDTDNDDHPIDDSRRITSPSVICRASRLGHRAL